MTNQVFSGRAKDYVKYRTDYVDSLADYLVSELHINKDQVIADMGSGTGLLAQLLVRLGARVFGVEPNDDMRAEGEKNLAGFNNFVSVAGCAEHSGLKDASIDIITAGNAFHWFDLDKARREFQRILKPQGRVILVRSDWKEFPAQRMKEYDRIIQKYCIGRGGIVSDPVLEKAAIKKFFRSFTSKVLGESSVQYSLEELKGRFLSTSFSPKPGHPQHEACMHEIEQLFRKFAQDGRFSFGVLTTVVNGTI